MVNAGADRVRVTLTSFLAYFIMSSVITPLGIVTQPMADHFGVAVTTATAWFSYLTTGILIGTFLSMFIYPGVGIRTVKVSAGMTLAASLGCIWIVDSLSWLPALFLLIGASCGLLLSAALIVLTKSFSERRRAPAMLVTDSFYSGAGVVSGITSGMLIERGYHWGSTYALAIIAAGLLIMIAVGSSYPDVEPSVKEPKHSVLHEPWPGSVYLLAAALLIYIMCFVFVYSWIPNYAAESVGSTAEQGGVLVSRFFLGLFFGQLAMFALVFKFSVRWLIGIVVCLATLASAGLWSANGYGELLFFMFLLGLLSGGLLKTLISYATTIVSNPSTRLVSFLVFCTAVGTSLAPAVSAIIVDEWGIRAVLVAISVGYAAMAALVLSTFSARRG